jgi:beta-lactamase class A
MIKTFIAALVSEDLAENPIAKRSGVIEIPRHIQAEGDGLLRFTELPTELTIDQLLMLMIAVSDNTATTALVERLGGVEAVNTRLAARGWDSRLCGCTRGRATGSSARCRWPNIKRRSLRLRTRRSV